MRIAGVLLCAGRSERFGAQDKLLHPVGGVPLAVRAARGLAGLDLAARFAVVRRGSAWLADEGFSLIEVGDGSQEQSVQAGLEAARGHDAVLLALGDMPCVSRQHFERLIAAADERPALSCGEDWLGPPWLARMDWLEAHAGNLREALRERAVRVDAPPGDLVDIDRPDDVARLGR